MGLTIVLVVVLASAYEADHGLALDRYIFICDASWMQ